MASGDSFVGSNPGSSLRVSAPLPTAMRGLPRGASSSETTGSTAPVTFARCSHSSRAAVCSTGVASFGVTIT